MYLFTRLHRRVSHDAITPSLCCPQGNPPFYFNTFICGKMGSIRLVTQIYVTTTLTLRKIISACGKAVVFYDEGLNVLTFSHEPLQNNSWISSDESGWKYTWIPSCSQTAASLELGSAWKFSEVSSPLYQSDPVSSAISATVLSLVRKYTRI